MYAADGTAEEQTAQGLGAEGTFDTAGAEPVPEDTAVPEEAPVVEEAAPVDSTEDASAAT
jgi:hypothetical protein